MAHRCVVKTWIRNHGFAESGDGKVVWVHQKELSEGQTLKVGGVINCDIEEVEGHSGRVRGVRVSGPGIAKAGYAPSKEEAKREEDDWQQYKKEHFKDTPRKERGEHGTGKGQPCGFTNEQIVQFACDPRMIALPEVPKENNGVKM